ncbi:hypothetical protein [Rubellimicrobium roseum]|uniref:Uncharacterized protein n=1 Tax=Rubellimicrobium roseum TaxID=687525 RepID=A0A5C4N9G0_9RHOB|nr:hypothetical protein [Rubellimicrobium roseum]TNC63552.1 hypothetical protein FHG71_19405 [Rubellimicrobium roseum]
MADTTRGLQVTIGDVTYSLEGFDDPVEALAVISDYLRGLEAQGSGEGPGDPVALRRALEQVRDLGPGRTAGPARAGRQRLPDLGAEGDAALNRMISRADRQLATPEATRKRLSLANQKAAVAATRADRALGTGRKGEPLAEPFRDDLRQVGPARARPEEPAAGRGPAPLPARDAAFADFVARAGLSDLPDLIDAATAWLVREGTGAVTRSRILSLAARIMTDPPERADALRCFEALLRDGRIARVGGDRFATGPESRFAGL